LRTLAIHRADFPRHIRLGEHRIVHAGLAAVFERQGGVATTAQILSVVSRRYLEMLLDCAAVERIWHGVYSRGDADATRKLRGLDLVCGEVVAVCLGTAAAVYGFDTEDTGQLHILNPLNHQIRPATDLIVHRRKGAPLITVAGRPTTAPSWTAIEVARGLSRRRALATLDAALRTGHCDPRALAQAASAQAGRRGIVKVRAMIPLADGRAESPMESEARLVMLDGGLPAPVLQHVIVDALGRYRRVDFAWPEYMVAAEYDSEAWHSGSDALRRDREKLAAIQELGWTVIPIVGNDVRSNRQRLVNRIATHLQRNQAV
jgi:hypothetical protein